MIKVLVEDCPERCVVKVYVVNRDEQAMVRYGLHFNEAGKATWELYEPATALEPTYVFDYDWSHELYEALHRMYGVKTEDPVRADYDREKYRVDKLIDYLIQSDYAVTTQEDQ